MLILNLPTCSGLVNPFIRSTGKEIFHKGYSKVSLVNFGCSKGYQKQEHFYTLLWAIGFVKYDGIVYCRTVSLP